MKETIVDYSKEFEKYLEETLKEENYDFSTKDIEQLLDGFIERKAEDFYEWDGVAEREGTYEVISSDISVKAYHRKATSYSPSEEGLVFDKLDIKVKYKYEIIED